MEDMAVINVVDYLKDGDADGPYCFPMRTSSEYNYNI